MKHFGIRYVSTHAEPQEGETKLRQWAEIEVWIDSRFDWSDTDALMREIKKAAELAGKPE